MAETSETIRDNALKPKSAAVDGRSMTQFSIDEQIKADEYAKKVAAGNRSALPIRLAKVKPGSSLG